MEEVQNRVFAAREVIKKVLNGIEIAQVRVYLDLKEMRFFERQKKSKVCHNDKQQES